jgi:hypothetical protein
MDNPLSHSLFQQHVNSLFGIRLKPLADASSKETRACDTASRELQLTLTEVTRLNNHADATREPFSLLFQGPSSTLLQQATYDITHPAMDPQPLFIVPIGQNDQGYLYEVVVN